MRKKSSRKDGKTARARLRPVVPVVAAGVRVPIVGIEAGEMKLQPTSDETVRATTLARIMATLKSVAGVDFKEHKPLTMIRRVARRMALRKIDAEETYLTLLQRDPDEVRALCEDTLIQVSSFFRDPEVFESLKASVFPVILKHKAEGDPIRIWVAGCSSGEEVYSLAIALLEFLADVPETRPLQIFGSDVSERAIQAARLGRYAEGAMSGLSEERRRRYFTKLESGYQINKNVRDLCVFARHDLANAPPFSRVDLLSCRNVLVYFDHTLQKRVLPTLHYSLNQPGFLVIGHSENIAGFGHLFSAVDEASRIFARSAGPSSLRLDHRSVSPSVQARPFNPGEPGFTGAARDLGRHLDCLLLARYAPPGVLVNERMEILQFRGQTGAYLQAPPGEPQNNIVKMARGGLRAQLRTTLARATERMVPVTSDRVQIDQPDGSTAMCDLVVLPFVGSPDLGEPLFLVLFEEHAVGSSARHKRDLRKDAGRIPRLEDELFATSEYLHALIDEQSRTNEDLGSVNEELVSGNEELQSLNEELEAAKEELQSINEELTTVNEELQVRNLEVAQINGDLVNLLNTVDVPILILDGQRRIRRFTPRSRNILNVLPSDVGRPLEDIRSNIDVPDLDQQVAAVIETNEASESDVQDRDGRWYRMQIRPYKTAEDQIDGAIVSLFDIDSLKHHIKEVQQAKEDAERADQAKDQFLAVLSHELRTPLTALQMQTQLLRQGGSDSAKRERACEAIERSTKMQVQLIDDLLDVSRIVTGKMRVALEPVNLVAVVKATLDSMGALAERKSIALRTFLDQSLGAVAGDRTRLEQVVTNLLTNAIKFTPEGGRVDVILEGVGGLAQLRVSDNGMGIDPAFLPRIFNRLTQEDSSSTRPHGGLGLGLAIVRHLVDAHGGTIRAESSGIGKGATFHLTFPVLSRAGATRSETQSMHVEPAPPRAHTRLVGRRILLVEDDRGTREALVEMFTEVGATIRTAGSAREGMNTFAEFQPDLLISDIAMPTEDGYALIRRVRALAPENGGATPALALTALAGETNRRKALSEGFQMHLAKPVDMTHLADAVAELLDRP